MFVISTLGSSEMGFSIIRLLSSFLALSIHDLCMVIKDDDNNKEVCDYFLIYTCYRQEALCFDCVRQRCRELHFKEQLAEHSRFIAAALKQPADRSVCVVSPGHW